jgi:flagellar secretion chaperone FliS
MNPYSQYQQNQIMSASSEQILLMLYDGAIRFTRRAISGLEENNLTDFRQGIAKSMAIITEFSNSLDHTIGGDIADNLDALYDFMVRELTQANLHKDADKLRVVEKILMDLRATWGEAVEINKQEKVPPDRAISSPRPQIKDALPESYVPLSISR